jgi:glucokinase
MAMVGAMGETVAALRTRHDDVVAVGAGVAGLVTRQGTVRYSPNLPGVVELAVGPLLAELVGLPVQLDNDATCALWGEHMRGAARGAHDVVLVTLGTGVGGGLLLDGNLVRGANGFAGEIGHMVVARGGIECVCGRRGCWERYASGSALGRMGREAGIGDRGEDVTAAALAGDATALAVFDEFADWFAVGLVNLVHVLDVERCVIAGGLVEAGEVLIDAVRRAFAARIVAPEHRPAVDIVGAELGERAGAVGAALLAVS